MLCHMWLCACCRSGSPGPAWSLLSDHRSPPGPSHRSTLSEWNPLGKWPPRQRIWQHGKHALKHNWQHVKSYFSDKWGFCFLLAKQRVQLFWNVVLFIFDLGFSQSDCDVGVGLPIYVCRMQICSLFNNNNNKNHSKYDFFLKDSSQCKMSKSTKFYPDDINADKNIDGVVAGNVLKHSHVGVEVRVSGCIIRHFVHTQRALNRNKTTMK